MATVHVQPVNHLPNAKPAYPFLSRPPPQKARPTQLLPAVPPCATKRRSYSAIAAWAAHVQPGSPGSPHSIRRTSLNRRTSGSSRLAPSPRSTSASFVLVETPAPSAKEFAIDLTQLGYTSVFIHLPETPATPAQFLQAEQQMPSTAVVNPDAFPKPPSRTLKTFRSLTGLRSRARSASVTVPSSPTHINRSTTRSPRSPVKPESPQILAASIAKRKKAVYAYAKASKTSKVRQAPLPPSLASELALMQFADGGSMDENIKRLMEAHAQASAPAGKKSGELAVGDIYRDGDGGIWMDRDEELEYAHLLSGQGPNGPEAKWVSFGGANDQNGDDELAIASLAGLAKRESSASTNSTASSLDPCNVVRPAEEDGAVIAIPACVAPSVPMLAPAPTKAARRASPPLLNLPSRPRASRQQHHLLGNPAYFLLDTEAFSVLKTPKTPHTPHTPWTPITPRTPLAPGLVRRQSLVKRTSPTHSAFAFTSPAAATRTRVRRRRPAPPPLKIVPQTSVREVERDEDVVMTSPPLALNIVDTNTAKREFLNDSFAPAPLSVPIAMMPPTAASGMTPSMRKKAPRFGLIFGRK